MSQIENENEISSERLYASGEITKIRARRSANTHMVWIGETDYHIWSSDDRDKHIFAVALAAVLNKRPVGILYRINEGGYKIVYHIELVN